MILDYDLELDVPFNDKETAKRLGVKPKFENAGFKCWYVPKGKDVTPFEKWWPAAFRNQVAPENPDEIQSYSLAQVMNGIGSVLQKSFSDALWIKAEVTGVTGANHKYLELVDYESATTGAPIKGRGTIFSSQMALLHKFTQETGMQLAPGMKIMFKAYVEFSGQYGLSLRIVDLNSEFVLGQAELNLQAIRNQLTKDGIIGNNKMLQQPKEFTRVALIAPDGAAGLGDFMTQANTLTHFGLCQFDHFPATFQGANTANSLVNAFNSVVTQYNAGIQYDAIVVIRGGGDKAGLYALNEYAIGAALCLMPIPVMVGIGHERDDTILDELANTRFPTPSMVISHIAGTIISNMKEMRELEVHLKKLAAEKCHMARLILERGESGIREGAMTIVSQAKRQIELAENEMMDSSKRTVDAAKNEVRLLTQEILFNDPSKILNKGYTIVKDGNGKTIGDGYSVASPGNKISITFRDQVVSAVTE